MEIDLFDILGRCRSNFARVDLTARKYMNKDDLKGARTVKPVSRTLSIVGRAETRAPDSSLLFLALEGRFPGGWSGFYDGGGDGDQSRSSGGCGWGSCVDLGERLVVGVVVVGWDLCEV